MDFTMDFTNIKKYLTTEFLIKFATTVVALIAIYFVYRLARKYIRKLCQKKLKPQTTMIVDKTIKYVFNVLLVMYILNLFGVKLNALLGAAGIAGVAIGFAAQTSFSNIISGFFMLGEHAFQIGDYITIDDVSGTVHSIDLLSVKVLTLDNQIVRVPNETIIKSNLKNTTFFPIRRMTIKVSVSYSSNLENVKQVLLTVPSKCSLVLTDPAPVVYYDGFGESGIDVVLGVWFKKEDFMDVKNAMYIAVLSTFNEAKIEIPFPQIVISTSEKSKMPIATDDKKISDKNV